MEITQNLVEKFLPKEEGMQYPLCIDGKLNCPPEDCGGIPGFYRMLEIIKSKKHPEKKEMLEWLGDKYDAQYFDMESVNEALSKLDEYIKESNGLG
ncbi:MAG: plasmid pRiA4b ORF-3 family protein [Bacteroidetes bacterium]|nr:plasmid pRiA4b ORF-3 family protein [Bacteroidota bacterium]